MPPRIGKHICSDKCICELRDSGLRGVSSKTHHLSKLSVADSVLDEKSSSSLEDVWHGRVCRRPASCPAVQASRRAAVPLSRRPAVRVPVPPSRPPALPSSRHAGVPTMKQVGQTSKNKVLFLDVIALFGCPVEISGKYTSKRYVVLRILGCLTINALPNFFTKAPERWKLPFAYTDMYMSDASSTLQNYIHLYTCIYRYVYMEKYRY